eukprot:4521630-Amphidinium_carterae.1
MFSFHISFGTKLNVEDISLPLQVVIPGDIFKMIRERYSKKVCNGLPPEAVVAQKFKQLGYQYDAIKWTALQLDAYVP